jgi:hemolysin activation/secretion protein
MPLHPLRALALAACLLAPSALAQTQPRVPLPGQVEREFTPPPALRVPARPLPAPPPGPAVPPRSPDLRLVVTEILVEGATVYSERELAPLLAPFIGKEIALDDIYLLAAELTAKYLADGYFLSRVLVPAQVIADGRVRLAAVEGYVADVRFQGTNTAEEAILRAYADRIRAVRPLTTAALERYLLLMNDLAGVDARSTLVPSAAGLGATDLVVDFSFTRAAGEIGGDNRGSRALGPWRAIASVDVNSLFGRFDQTRLFAASTLNSKQNYASLLHAEPIGAEGARLVLVGWGASARPDPSTLGGLQSAESRSWSAGAFYHTPFVRSRAVNLTARVGLLAEEGRFWANGIATTEDDLRVVRAGIAFDAIDRFGGSNLVDVELAQGLNALGARRTTTAALPVTTGKSDFTKVALYAARLQPLDANWSLFAAVNGQYGFSTIPTLEQFAFGGEFFGRGYDPSEIVGDSGASLKLDLARELGTIGESGVTLAGYAFYDLGAVYLRSSRPGATSHASAASAGVGVRARYRASLYAYLEVAKPLTLTPVLEGNKDARVYFGLLLRF